MLLVTVIIAGRGTTSLADRMQSVDTGQGMTTEQRTRLRGPIHWHVALRRPLLLLWLRSAIQRWCLLLLLLRRLLMCRESSVPACRVQHGSLSERA